jgi:hypothetical protein
MGVVGVQSPSIEYVDYVFLLPGNVFSRDFLLSWSNTLVDLMLNNVTFRFFSAYNTLLSLNRNTLLGGIEAVMRSENSTTLFEGRIVCKKVVFIDSDMVWSIEDMRSLLLSPYDVVSGVYSSQDNERCVVMKSGYDMYSIEEMNTKKEPFVTESAGLGFVACSFEALTKLPFPWFDVSYLKLDNTKKRRVKDEDLFISEDRYFFKQLKDAGYDLHIDPSIRVGHQKNLVLGTSKDSVYHP